MLQLQWCGLQATGAGGFAGAAKSCEEGKLSRQFGEAGSLASIEEGAIFKVQGGVRKGAL